MWGNFLVVWLWYCDDKFQLKGVGSIGILLIFMVIVKFKDYNVVCYCRVKSDFQWGSYDKNFLKVIININVRYIILSLDLFVCVSLKLLNILYGEIMYVLFMS